MTERAPHPARQTATRRSGVHLIRALSPDILPRPPARPPAALALLGFAALEGERVLELADGLDMAIERVQAGSRSESDAAAWLIDGDSAREPLGPVADARNAGDVRPVLVVAVDRVELIARQAYLAGAHFLAGPVQREDLEHLHGLAVAHQASSACHLARWCRAGLSQWILEVLGACGVTARQAEIIALATLGLRRMEIARALGVRMAKVDDHIGAILKCTGQHRLDHVTDPFRKRLAQESEGGYSDYPLPETIAAE
jgi:DNA-binding NarL/FixJ family response regulator